MVCVLLANTHLIHFLGHTIPLELHFYQKVEGFLGVYTESVLVDVDLSSEGLGGLVYRPRIANPRERRQTVSCILKIDSI